MSTQAERNARKQARNARQLEGLAHPVIAAARRAVLERFADEKAAAVAAAYTAGVEAGLRLGTEAQGGDDAS